MNLKNRLLKIESLLNNDSGIVIPENIKSLSDKEINELYLSLQSKFGDTMFPDVDSYSEESINELYNKLINNKQK